MNSFPFAFCWQALLSSLIPIPLGNLARSHTDLACDLYLGRESPVWVPLKVALQDLHLVRFFSLSLRQLKDMTSLIALKVARALLILATRSVAEIIRLFRFFFCPDNLLFGHSVNCLILLKRLYQFYSSFVFNLCLPLTHDSRVISLHEAADKALLGGCSV